MDLIVLFINEINRHLMLTACLCVSAYENVCFFFLFLWLDDRKSLRYYVVYLLRDSEQVDCL